MALFFLFKNVFDRIYRIYMIFSARSGWAARSIHPLRGASLHYSLVTGFWLLITGYCLLSPDSCLLVSGYWSLSLTPIPNFSLILAFLIDPGFVDQLIYRWSWLCMIDQSADMLCKIQGYWKQTVFYRLPQCCLDAYVFNWWRICIKAHRKL
mgnify:CR=1 FL=1